MNTILLTGLPRSGTTLACACLNDMPDCVALAEPMSFPPTGDVDKAVEAVLSFAATTRQRALAEGRAVTMTAGGDAVPEQWFDKPVRNGGLRPTRGVHRDIALAKPLSPDFKLFIKHPMFFTAIAHRLRERFPLYAIVRDPLEVLASWQTVDIPVNRGRGPVAEAFCPALGRALDALPSPRARQLHLLAWMFDIYAALPADTIIRYEDLIGEPARVLARLGFPDTPLNLRFTYEAPDKRYPGIDLGELAQDLTPFMSRFRTFYPDIEDRLARFR